MNENKIPLLDLKAQIQSIESELVAAFTQTLSKGDFVSGESVRLFENDFSQFLGAGNVIGCGNGTDALFLTLKSLGIQPGDYVIVPSMSFVASAEPVVILGAIPIFCDVDLQTEVLSAAALNELLENLKKKSIRPKALILVHLRGNACPMDDILDLAQKHDLWVIEDAAQAHGAQYKNKMVGTLAHAATFSFYPGKNLGALGDAGAISTGDELLAKKIKQLRDHGRVSKYDHETVGVNSRLDTLQAAFLRVKLKYLPSWNSRRREVAKLYNKYLERCEDIILPTETAETYHVYHHYSIKTDQRDVLSQRLVQKNISTVIHYPKPIHLQLAFKEYENFVDLKNSETIARQTLSLPIYPELTEIQVQSICETILTYFGDHR